MSHSRTGRIATRLMPRSAASGRLTEGVAPSPQMAANEDNGMDERSDSSTLVGRARARTGSAATAGDELPDSGSSLLTAGHPNRTIRACTSKLAYSCEPQNGGLADSAHRLPLGRDVLGFLELEHAFLPAFATQARLLDAAERCRRIGHEAAIQSDHAKF